MCSILKLDVLWTASSARKNRREKNKHKTNWSFVSLGICKTITICTSCSVAPCRLGATASIYNHPPERARQVAESPRRMIKFLYLMYHYFIRRVFDDGGGGRCGVSLQTYRQSHTVRIVTDVDTPNVWWIFHRNTSAVTSSFSGSHYGAARRRVSCGECYDIRVYVQANRTYVHTCAPSLSNKIIHNIECYRQRQVSIASKTAGKKNFTG